MKILILTQYESLGASSRVRFYQYLQRSELSNYSFTSSPLLCNAYLERKYSGKRISIFYYLRRFFLRVKFLLKLNKYDVIWIEKEIFPYFPPLLEKILNILNVPYVVDYDDAVFHNYDSSNNFFVRQFLSSKIPKVMKYSTYVVSGNNYIAQKAKKSEANNIKVIPTVVDHTRYDEISDTVIKSDSKPIVIGWMGTPSTQKYLVGFKNVLLEISKNREVEYQFIGPNCEFIKQFDGIPVKIIKWKEDKEVSDINNFDIGIMPLEDGRWEKGKCGYKLIQYMACGVPVVGSDVGVNKEIVLPNQCGFISNNDSDWYNNLLCLIDNSKLRKEMGRQGKRAVKEKYSIQSQVLQLKGIFDELS